MGRKERKKGRPERFPQKTRGEEALGSERGKVKGRKEKKRKEKKRKEKEKGNKEKERKKFGNTSIKKKKRKKEQISSFHFSSPKQLD